MRKLLLRQFQSPGDIVMLTAAVRDLHATYPGEFATDVETSCPDLWEHNPYIQPLDRADPELEIVDCQYPLIHQSNQKPFHFIHGFIRFLNEKLGLRIEPGAFRGDIHLSHEEAVGRGAIAEMLGRKVHHWLVNAGGKNDFTIKWWSHERYQRVIDAFAGRILFVQVGAADHHHPPLKGVIDMRGRTTIRQLVGLVYRAQGVLTPVSLPMHLAAAVPTVGGAAVRRACVVVAGGREPPHWEAYPTHQFIHTVGSLECCRTGGCWRARTLPLGDGDEKDHPNQLCLDVVGDMPRCMEMIRSEDVIRRIEWCFENGSRPWLQEGVELPPGGVVQ